MAAKRSSTTIVARKIPRKHVIPAWTPTGRGTYVIGITDEFKNWLETNMPGHYSLKEYKPGDSVFKTVTNQFGDNNLSFNAEVLIRETDAGMFRRKWRFHVT